LTRGATALTQRVSTFVSLVAFDALARFDPWKSLRVAHETRQSGRVVVYDPHWHQEDS